MPLLERNPVNASGVSAAKVVATIEVPASHHGTSRPERKNSLVLPRARRESEMPMLRLKTKYAAMMNQSNDVSCISVVCASNFVMEHKGTETQRHRGRQLIYD